jgi:hypothetical protein
MLMTSARRARRVAGWAGIVCAALLATACNAQTGPNVVVTDAPNPSVAYLAQGQNLHGKLLFEPACSGFGCALSGDSTVFLSKMKWTTWSETEAVGTGIDKIDGCNPDCAAGPIYSVPTVVTLSNPVKALRGGNAPLNPWVFSSLKSEAKHSCAS